MIVLDTHALIWWVTNSSKLSTKARKLIEAAARNRTVVTSAISIFEIATAVRRGRLVFNIPVDAWLHALGQMTELGIEPITAEIARIAASFDDVMPGDPADRIIAATTLTLNARLVTKDTRLNKIKQLKIAW